MGLGASGTSSAVRCSLDVRGLALERFAVRTWILLVRGCPSSTVRVRIANRALASSKATSAEGSPESLMRVVMGVVFHTGSTPLAASVIALCTRSI